MSDFDPWNTRADPERIRASAAGLRSISGVLLGHGNNVGTVLSEVALSFSEVIAPAVVAQIEGNAQALETAVEGTEYGYAVGSAWADDVDAFLAARDALLARWEAAELDDFGAWPPIGLANAEADMAEQMYANRNSTVGAARTAALRTYDAEGLRLWEEFQLQVELRGRMFREGPTASNLSMLVSYLGWAAMTLWPEFATTPVTGAAEGAAAGTTVIEGLDGTTGPEAVAEALSTVAMITRRAEYGQELTAEELAYLEAFYAAMGDRVLDIPSYLASRSGPTMSDANTEPTYLPTVPFNGSPELVQTLTVAAANGLLVLSRPTTRTGDDGHEGYERLPAWLREDLAWDPAEPYSDPAGHFARLTDLGDLLNSSTLEAGTGLSRELAASVPWMIDYAADPQPYLRGDPGVADLRAEVAASAPALLDVVSRNDEVCFGLVTGTGMPDGYSPVDYFTDIYAFDWAVDNGAAAAGLTDFIPEWAGSSDPDERARSQVAMFDLVQIVTGDSAFSVLMDSAGTSRVASESAVGQVNPAITQGFVNAMAPFMDQFAAPQGSEPDPRGLRDLPFETRVRFATLIGTDPVSATALSAAAYAYEQQQLYDYAVSADPSVSGGNVGRIRAIVDAGIINAGIDAGADHIEAAATAARTRQMGLDIAQGVIDGIPVPGFSSVVDAVFAVFDAQTGADGVGQNTLEALSPPLGEDERRYDTVSSVMVALVASGQIPEAALPVPLIGPVAHPPTPEELTDDLLRIAAAFGYDLTPILERIESAYSDQDLADERDD